MKKYLLLLLMSISAIAILSITAPTAVSYSSQFSCTLPAGIGCGELHTNVEYMSTYVVSTSPSGVAVCAGYSNGVYYTCIKTYAGRNGLDFTSDILRAYTASTGMYTIAIQSILQTGTSGVTVHRCNFN